MILFLLALHIRTQAQLQWVKTFGGPIDGYAGHGLALAVTADGTVYATGGFYGTIDVGGGSLTANSTGSDVLVLKLNTGGEHQWSIGFGGMTFFQDPSEYGRYIAVDALHDHVVVGGSIHTAFTVDTIAFDGSTTSSDGNTFLAGFDTDGNIQWGRTIACNSGRVLLLDMHVGSTGVTYGFGYATCQTTAPGTTPQVLGPGGFIVKYSSDGDLISAETPVSGGLLSSVDWLSPNEWLMAGEFHGTQASVYDEILTKPPGQNYIGYLVRTDTLGNVQWSKVLPSTTGSNCYAVAHDPNGLSYVLGFFFTDLILDNDTILPESGPFGYFLAALNDQGAFQWALPFSGSIVSDRRIGLSPDGSVYVSGRQMNDTLWIGTTPYPPLSDIDHYVAHVGTEGQVLGLLRSPNSASTYGSVVPTADALYLSYAFDSTMQFVDTTLTNPGADNWSFLVAKLDDLDWTNSIRGTESSAGELHIYPNPNNGRCTIVLPEELRLTNDLMLSVYDNTGLLVQRVPLHYSDQGVRVDIREQARGIYHLELGDGQQRYTGTIVFE